MFFVVGPVKKRDGTLANQPEQLGESCPLLRLSQLRTVASLKLVPALWIVPEPLAQGSRRRQFAQPEVQIKLFLLDTARPDTVDQDPLASRRWAGVV